MKTPMHFCVIVARYSISGVPLAQIRLAKALSARGYHVDLIIGHMPDEYAMPDLGAVKVQILQKENVRSMLGSMIGYFKNSRPDVLFTAEDHLNFVVILAAICTRTRTKISASSRVTPFDTYSDKRFSKGWILKKLMRNVMWRADALTCVSEDMVFQYREIFPKARHVCVYNIVGNADASARIAEHVNHPWFADHSVPVCVAAGQLGPWKGFDNLIRAIHIVGRTKRLRLIILGEGPQRSELQALIDQLELGDRVRLEGNVSNTLKYFANADVFVLSSLLEGMPNVLIEAMMAGCTPVATDCPTGPREVLESGRYGYLVEMQNPSALAKGIENALNKPIPPEILAEAIRPFEENTVIERHFEVLGL